MENEFDISKWREAAFRLVKTQGLPKNESRTFEVMNSARMLLDEFEVVGEDHNDSSTIALLLDLSRRARDNNRIEQYAARLRKLIEPDYTKAVNQLIGVYYKKGDFEEACKQASRVHDRLLQPHTKKRLATIGIVRDICAKLKRAHEVVWHRPDKRLPDTAGIVLGSHLEPYKAECLRAILCGIPSSAESLETTAIHKVETKERLRLIFCGGFRWSGASAVCDFLTDFPHTVRAPFAMRFFTGPRFTIQSIERAFQARDKCALVAQMRGLSIRLFAGVVADENQSESKVLQQWTRSLAVREWRGRNDRIVTAALNFFTKLMVDINIESPTFPAAECQHFIEAILHMIAPEDTRVVLFDSVLRAHECSMVSLLQDAHMFCVLRDPRDMFVTHSSHSLNTIDVEDYIINLQNMLRSYQNGFSSACSPVEFEEFILSDHSREVVRQKVFGFDRVDVHSPSFNPQDSATNIGVYRNYADLHAINRIYQAFPELCRQSGVV